MGKPFIPKGTLDGLHALGACRVTARTRPLLSVDDRLLGLHLGYIGIMENTIETAI